MALGICVQYLLNEVFYALNEHNNSKRVEIRYLIILLEICLIKDTGLHISQKMDEYQIS
jgi:hypothetical protein